MKKILIVDDEDSVRESIARVLKLYKYEVKSACNGEEGVKAYKEYRPDATFMDIKMPIKNGIDASREIIEFDPNAKIIISTAYGDENLVVETAMLGCINFIDKPFTTECLLTALKTIFEEQ